MHAKTGRFLLTAASAIVLSVLLSIPALATPVTYTLDTTNVSGFAAPYANVTLDLSNDNKSISVTVKTLGDYVLAGGNRIFGFDYSGSDKLVLSGGSGIWLTTSNSSMSQFGNFDYYINSRSSKALGNTLAFSISRYNGQTFSDLSALADPNGSGNLFALHLKPQGSPLTGYAGGGTLKAPPTPTPEPSSLALLGAGLVTLGGFARRMRRKKDL